MGMLEGTRIAGSTLALSCMAWAVLIGPVFCNNEANKVEREFVRGCK